MLAPPGSRWLLVGRGEQVFVDLRRALVRNPRAFGLG